MGSIPLTTARAERADDLFLLWGAAGLVAGLGAAIAYMASPGVNWGIWTSVAAGGLAVITHRTRGRVDAELAGVLALAVVLSFGAAVTANGAFDALILCGTTTLMAVALLLAGGARAEDAGLAFIALAPVRGSAACTVESARRAGELASAGLAGRGAAAVRGALVAFPIVVLFALLLSAADPTLALLRDDAARLLAHRDWVPRVAFFIALGVLTLGAYGIVLRSGDAPARATGAAPFAGPTSDVRSGAIRLGATERLITLGAVSGLFALFFLLQIAYLFGNPGARAGSGMTYAEFARHGFGELTVAASLAALLIITLDRMAERGEERERSVRFAALLLIALVQLLLHSAFRRVMLYESAYGFTAARLYAQAYMIVVSLALIALGYEVWEGVDVRRLTRRVAVLGTVALIALAYWNHEGWIARANLARYDRTGKLDVRYLTTELSPDVVPAVLAALPALHPADASRVEACLATRYDGEREMGGAYWYEWSARRWAAKRAFERAGLVGKRSKDAWKLCHGT